MVKHWKQYWIAGYCTHPNRPHQARGMCRACYSKWCYDNDPEYRNRKLRYNATHKEEIRVKNHNYFITHKEQLRPKVRIRGLRYYHRHKDEINRKNREKRRVNPEPFRARGRKSAKLWRQRYPEKMRDNNLKARIGITQADYDRAFKKQKGKCRLCFRAVTLTCDHNHETKVFRGLLCQRCNVAVAFVEKTEWFKAAIEYLRNPPAQLIQSTPNDNR
jgi:hypothetical protein